MPAAPAALTGTAALHHRLADANGILSEHWAHVPGGCATVLSLQVQLKLSQERPRACLAQSPSHGLAPEACPMPPVRCCSALNACLQAPEAHVKGALLDEDGMSKGTGAKLFHSREDFFAALRDIGELEEYERIAASLRKPKPAAPDQPKEEWEEPHAEAAVVM